MKERKGDARIYIVIGFFLLCIVSGGVLLGLYIFLPETYSQEWYPIAGMILVGIPWIFWLFAYLYRCFLPSSNVNNYPSAAATSSRTPSRASPGTVATSETLSCEEEYLPAKSPVSPGRHVHFGAVVVMGCEGNNKNVNGDQDHRNRTDQGHHQLSAIPENEQGEAPSEMASKKASFGPRESEIPLAFSQGC